MQSAVPSQPEEPPPPPPPHPAVVALQRLQEQIAALRSTLADKEALLARSQAALQAGDLDSISTDTITTALDVSSLADQLSAAAAQAVVPEPPLPPARVLPDLRGGCAAVSEVASGLLASAARLEQAAAGSLAQLMNFMLSCPSPTPSASSSAADDQQEAGATALLAAPAEFPQCVCTAMIT